jgi:hypothetical protein
MVRKGSPVRVRQRALGNPLETAGFVVQARLGAGPHGPYGSVWKQLAALDAPAVLCGLSPAALGEPPNAARINDLRTRAPPGLALTFRGGRDPHQTASERPDHTEPGGPAVAASPEPRREIADFFAPHERDLRQSVASRVRYLPAAAVEDACQTAWEKLCRSDVELRATGRA